MIEPTNQARPGPQPSPEGRPNVLGDVASAVVHSGINRFSAIVSQAEMITSQRLGPADVAGRSEAIIRAALEGSSLARRLAEHSRRALPPELAPVNLDDLIADRLEARRGLVPDGVVLIADLQARAVFPGDPPRLLIMLDCLVDNAVEAVADSRRGGTVVVSTRLDPRGWLELDVRDDGPGMAPDVLEQALEPFFSTKPDHSGLGLPLARSIWRRHRGAFSIDAPAGFGTLVRLTRPPAD